MIPLDPLSIALGAVVWLAVKKKPETAFGSYTEERQELYVNAMEHLKDPTKLQELAELFQKYGLEVQSKMFRARASWYARSPSTKEQHEQIFSRAMASYNADAISEVAAQFERLTATVKAKQLRTRVAQLEAGEIAPPVEVVEAVPEAAVPVKIESVKVKSKPVKSVPAVVPVVVPESAAEPNAAAE